MLTRMIFCKLYECHIYVYSFIRLLAAKTNIMGNDCMLQCINIIICTFTLEKTCILLHMWIMFDTSKRDVERQDDA